MTAGVVAVILAVVLIAGIMLYNTLVRRQNAVEQAFSTIDVQLTQRYDLIPKLVETVKQFMTHERSLLEDIVRLRSQAMGGRTTADKVAANNELTNALGRLNVQVENYPQLRSSDTFVNLQRSLNEVEEQLAAARRSYNAAVTEYNNAIETFPSSLVAGVGGFRGKEVFAAEAQKRNDVDMKALFKA
jgi:LemA protein